MAVIWHLKAKHKPIITGKSLIISIRNPEKFKTALAKHIPLWRFCRPLCGGPHAAVHISL